MPGYVNPPGYMSMATLKAGIEGQVARITNRAGARAEMATLSWKDLIERGYLVAGSPATVADRINDMADKLNVGHLMTLLALRQHVEGHHDVQHADVRREGHPAAAAALQRMGGQLVSARCPAPGCAGRSVAGGGVVNSEIVSLPNGRRWQVYSGGAGPQLLWLHGLRGVDPADPTLAALQTRYRVTAPVAPGFNDLDELSRIDNIHELALDYDDLIDALGLHGFTLIGHSFGAMIAAEIAAHFPGRAERLVLLAPFGLWNDAYPVADIFAMPYTQIDDILWHDPAKRERLRPAGRDRRRRQDRGRADRQAGAEPHRGDQVRLADPRPRSCAGGCRASRVRRWCCSAPRTGSSRRAMPTTSRPAFATAQTAVVAGAGHMLPYEKPEEVEHQLKGFDKAAKVA